MKLLTTLPGFFDRGMYDIATSYLNTCLDICEELEHPDEEILARHLLGQIAYRQGNFDKSEAICHEALAIHEAHPMPLGAVRVLRLFMDIAIERQQPDLALAMAERATDIAQQARLQDDLIEIRYGVAVVRRILGRYGLALNLAREVFEVSERTGKILFQILSLHEQSVAMKLLGQYDKAFEMAQRSLSLFADGEEHFNRVICLLNMGEIQEGLGRIRQARSTYSHALGIAEEIGHPRISILRERIAALGWW